MQVTVINSNDINSFNHLLYPDQHPGNITYIQNQFNSINPNMLTDVGNRYIQKAKDWSESIFNSPLAQSARHAIRAAAGMFHPNMIQCLRTLEELRYAQPVMQRWIMAEPELRSYYNKNLAEGYDGSYVNNFPNKLGDDHYDYRRVMDGIVVADEKGWEYTNYHECLLPDDRELTLLEQRDILTTWDIMKAFVQAGEDLSSKDGSKLGFKA